MPTFIVYVHILGYFYVLKYSNFSVCILGVTLYVPLLVSWFLTTEQSVQTKVSIVCLVPLCYFQVSFFKDNR